MRVEEVKQAQLAVLKEQMRLMSAPVPDAAEESESEEDEDLDPTARARLKKAKDALRRARAEEARRAEDEARARFEAIRREALVAQAKVRRLWPLSAPFSPF